MTHRQQFRGLAREDRGDIVLGWLTRVTAVIASIAIVSFDAGSVAATSLMLSDQGSHAARHASAAWHTTPNPQIAYVAAVEAATAQNRANLVDASSFTVNDDGTVHLQITREATTLVAHRIPALRSWLTVTRSEYGRSTVS